MVVVVVGVKREWLAVVVVVVEVLIERSWCCYKSG